MARFQPWNLIRTGGRAFSIEDREGETVISGISVMTEGPAVSHFVTVGEGKDAKEYQLMIDATTIAEVVEASRQYQNGVKVKANHRSGVQDVIGRLTNFEISKTEDGKTKGTADFHLFKTSPLYAHMLNLLKTIPDAIGFSAFFDGPVQKISDLFFARCKELFSVDLVGEPSTNPSGVFEIKVDSEQKEQANKSMTPDEIKTACEAALAPHLSAYNTRMGAMEEAMSKMSSGKAAPAAQTAAAPGGQDDDAMYSRLLTRISADTRVGELVTAAVTKELENTGKTLLALGLAPGAGPKSSVGNEGGQAKKIEDMTFLEVIAHEFSKPVNAGKRDYEIIREVTMAYPAKHKVAMEEKDGSGRYVGLSRLPARLIPFKAA